MKNTIKIGKINLLKAWGNPNGKKDCKLECTIELTQISPAKTRFSVTADVYSAYGKLLLWGQCLDELAELPELQSNELFMKIYTLWSKHHLNDMHAGTPEQEQALKTAVANGIIPSLSIDHYDLHKEYLQSIGLYQVELADHTMYRYGHGWQYQPIPSEDLELIQELLQIK